MPGVSSSVTINQPVEKVFAYLIDVANHKAWQASILEATASPAGPVGVGTTYTYTSEVMGHRMQSAMQVSQFETNALWAVRTVNVPNSVETVYRFSDAGGATALTIEMELSGGYPAAAEAMVKAQMEKSLQEQAARIRQLVE